MKTILLSLVILFGAVFSFAQDTEGPGQFPFTSVRLVTKEDIQDKSASELKIMRNEIFARHGHTFKGADMIAHFTAQPWYKATVADATSRLTETEKKNAEFIRKWEDKIAASSDFETFYKGFVKAVKAGNTTALSEMILPGDYFDTADDFYRNYERDGAEVEQAVGVNTPKGTGNTRYLYFGEYYQKVQYKSVEFKQEGCCWYINAFRRAG